MPRPLYSCCAKWAPKWVDMCSAWINMLPSTKNINFYIHFCVPCALSTFVLLTSENWINTVHCNESKWFRFLVACLALLLQLSANSKNGTFTCSFYICSSTKSASTAALYKINLFNQYLINLPLKDSGNLLCTIQIAKSNRICSNDSFCENGAHAKHGVIGNFAN